MAQGKKSFILYTDQRGLWDKLSEEQAGRLIKHIFKYVCDENPEALDFITEIAFEPIKQNLKRDLKSWEKKQNQRKEAGKKSAEARKRNATTVNDSSFSSTVNVNDNVNVSTNVDDILRPYHQFIEEVKKGQHQIVVENWLMKFKIPSHALTDILRVDFKTQLLTDGKVHKNTLEVRQHFYNFINTYERMGKLKQHRSNAG